MKSVRTAITKIIEEEQANKEEEVPEILTSEVRKIFKKTHTSENGRYRPDRK